MADPHYGSFANDPSLKDSEIATIRAWVETGAIEGDPKDLPKAPESTTGWELGRPDVVIDIGQTYTLKTGRDSYEHFVVETNLKEGAWIRAADLHPGNRKVVHHAHVNLVQRSGGGVNPLEQYLVHDGNLTRISETAPLLDDSCQPDAPNLPFIRGAQEGALASYLPGRSPDNFGDGRAKWIPPGAKLEFVIHYAPLPGGETASDRTSVGLYIVPGPPEQVLRRMDLRNFFFRIPAGEPAHTVRRCYAFERDQTLLSITPHMHYRGKDARYDLIRPDGTRETLLNVPKYDFNWQLVYRMRDPVKVEKGSRLEVTVHFDNSANNPANPDATKSVRWGDKTEEEMMTSWIEYVEPKTP